MRRRAFTLAELMISLTILSTVIIGTVSLMVTGMRSYKRTAADVEITNQNANSLRHVSDLLRQAINISISNSGKTISFNLPLLGGVDPTTGEKELLYPLTSDGVARSLTVDVATGKLIEQPGNRVLAKNVLGKDPLASSSQYGQAYAPFQLTTIGSYRAVTINLITQQNVAQESRTMRMKTTAIVRNAK